MRQRGVLLEECSFFGKIDQTLKTINGEPVINKLIIISSDSVRVKVVVIVLIIL